MYYLFIFLKLFVPSQLSWSYLPELVSFIILFKVPNFDLLSSVKLNFKSTRVDIWFFFFDIWFYRDFFTTLLGCKAVFLAFLGLGGITLLHPSFRGGMYPYRPHMLDIPWARCLSKLKMSKLILKFTQIFKYHWGQKQPQGYAQLSRFLPSLDSSPIKPYPYY